jgi:glycosyltransferase involved in cell wall biosynthesis
MQWLENRQMAGNSGPVLSAVIVTSAKNGNLRRTIAGLRNQEMRSLLEIILVTASTGRQIPRDLDTDCFFGVKVIELDPMTCRGEARLCGVRNASAPVVAFVEDHAYPDDGWGEALLGAHTGLRAAVGYQICNANPASAVSWANLFLFYGPWVEHAAPAADILLPSENISYRRDILLQYGDSLASFFENDYVLHMDLRRRGFSLYLEPAARLFHWNIDTYPAAVFYSYMNGVIFAAARSSQWRVARRLLYAGGSFLIPFIRAPRILGDFLRTGRGKLLPGCVPALLVGLLAGASGEMAGYLLGAAKKELLGEAGDGNASS